MARVRRAQQRRVRAATTLANPTTSAPQAADATIRWNYTPEEWAWFDGWARRQFWWESILYVGGFFGPLVLLLVFLGVRIDSPTNVLLIYIPLVVIWAWLGYGRLQDL